ncbi:MAG: histidine kinase dimerization/phospho-acceptor domain-containing protein [Rhodocyclaceae bacterium]
MSRRFSLRARLAAAFAGLGALVVMLLTLAIAYGAHDVAQRLMDQTLAAEIEDYIARHERNPASLPPATVGLRGYVAPLGELDIRLPESIRPLPPGRHEIELDGIPYRVAIEERAGWRYVILFDETRQKRREARFFAWLAGGAMGVVMIVFLGAWWLAGRALSPLSELSAAISRADPENPPRLSHPGAPDDELSKLANAFEHYAARLREFVARERAFTADASHELRTPLAVIRGAAELLAGDPTLPAAARERAQRIERAARRMAELVEALLLLAREETASGRCEAAELARETAERLTSLCQGRHLTVRLATADSVRLRLAEPLFIILFGNLLRNACAHARSRVDVELNPAHLLITDDGPGMTEDALAVACQRHWRGPESQGAGIGLALVKRICEVAGFGLQLGNRPEGGFMAEVEFSSRSGDAIL